MRYKRQSRSSDRQRSEGSKTEMRLPVYIKTEGSEERLVNNEKAVDPDFYKQRRKTWNVSLTPGAAFVYFSLVKMMCNL